MTKSSFKTRLQFILFFFILKSGNSQCNDTINSSQFKFKNSFNQIFRYTKLNDVVSGWGISGSSGLICNFSKSDSIIWAKKYSAGNVDGLSFYNGVQLKNGGYLSGGDFTFNNFSGESAVDMYLQKVTPQGSILWKKRFNIFGNPRSSDISFVNVVEGDDGSAYVFFIP